jgi:sortase A
MAFQPRSSRTSNNQDALELLQTLIEAPPAPSSVRLQPIALRSATEHRRHALSRYMLRTWVDGLLRHTERLLMLITCVIFLVWFVDGPLRDWLHERQQSLRTAPSAIAAAPHAGPAPADGPLDRSVPLPYTTLEMERTAPESDFLAPRQSISAAPLLTAPQPTRLLIPAIGLDTPVKEVFIVDGAWEVADYAAGYLHDTALPGEKGNTALAGHAGMRGAVFRDLGALGPGAEIYLDAAGWRYHYRVRETKSVLPTQVDVLAPTDTPVLTLLTCTNWDTQRLVVVADLVDSKPAPGA